jgi:hypothetical protein
MNPVKKEDKFFSSSTLSAIDGSLVDMIVVTIEPLS